MAALVLDLTDALKKRLKPQNGNYPPRRRPNVAVRSRGYLTPDEVQQLTTAARTVGRQGHRDATIILLAYRHALRVSEFIALRWDQIDLRHGLLHVGRLKNGTSSVRALGGPYAR
jgi:type 1 fimbriae regulatory protein FimE